MQCANDPSLEACIETAVDDIVKCAHCNCKAGLGEVCSDISAVLFYVEADLPCQWIMPSSIEAIPSFSRIHDFYFSVPKSILLTTKRGAHLVARWVHGFTLYVYTVSSLNHV